MSTLGLGLLKSECNKFLSKLDNFSRQNIGIDDELIKILYEMTLVIDDFYAQNQIVDFGHNANAAVPNGTDSKGLDMMCDVCNVNIGRSKADFDIHVNGKRHQLKVAANKSNAHQLAAPSNKVSIAKLPHNISYNAANGQIAVSDDKGVHIGTDAVANLPDLTTLSVSDSKSGKAMAGNSLLPIATTSEMAAGQSSNHNSNRSSANMETKVCKKTIIIGIDGNQIPGNKIAGSTTNGSDILCDICNVNVPGSDYNFTQHSKGKRHELNAAAIKIKASLALPTPSSNSTCDPKRIINYNSFAFVENAGNGQISDGDDNLGKNRKIADVSEEKTLKNYVTMSSIETAEKITRDNDRFDKILKNTMEMFPHAKVYMYGSRSYQINDNESDINIYVDFDNGYQQLVSKARMTAKNVVLDKTLREYSNYWKNLRFSYRSYLYPVIKAIDKTSAAKCTFSFANGSFVEQSKRLMEYIKQLPMIRDFVQLLKKWQSNCGDFQFSSYQLTILVVWYFQYREYLPSVRMLQNGSGKVMCGDAQVNFNQPLKLMKPVIGELNEYAEDFFDIFGNQYVPERDVVCPHFGKLLRRKINKNDPNVDADNAKLFNLMENARVALWNPPTAYMYVHDMFLHNLCPNITTDITQAAVNSFQAHCKMTAKTLKSANQN